MRAVAVDALTGRAAEARRMTRPIVVRPGEGHRVGNVEFLARSADTPRFSLEHTFVNRGDAVVRMVNVHAPAGFDLRLEAD